MKPSTSAERICLFAKVVAHMDHVFADLEAMFGDLFAALQRFDK
jgi:hypothetical protein